VVPKRYLPLRLRGLRIGPHYFSVDVNTSGAWVTGLEDTDVQVLPGPVTC
jgi:hypothetical protein